MRSTTLWALSCDLPAGIVAPIIILGALVGRIYVQLLPEWHLGPIFEAAAVGYLVGWWIFVSKLTETIPKSSLEKANCCYGLNLQCCFFWAEFC